MNARSGQPDPVTSIDWVHRANALQAPWGMFVDGEQRPAISGSVAPALAAGCTVVLKTAEQSPLSMQRVAQLGLEAGLPPGVFNVLSGDGLVAGRALG